MDLCRVVYKADGSVSVIHPVPEARLPKETDAQFLEREATKAMRHPKLKGLLFDDINVAMLPPRKEREKWSGVKGEGVRVDNSIKTRVEKQAAKEKRIDDEAGKTKPNFKLIIKLQRELADGNVD